MEINKEYKFCATLIAPPVNVLPLSITLRKNCAYLKLFWFIFSRIRTEYGKILRISPYSVRLQENTDQNNSEYGHFLRRVIMRG